MFAGFVIKGLGEVRSRFCQSELRDSPILNYAFFERVHVLIVGADNSNSVIHYGCSNR